ncbi:Hsp20/alpha crystallin family protein [Candidatus Thioglobus sp.]|uniref:Hsp20/alpha crystallin family protein n=1 Tax=Candidatus Thioglobus sp. TaxID=2026721 RepID=UPI003D09D76A
MNKLLTIFAFICGLANAQSPFYGGFFDHSAHNNINHLNNLSRYFQNQTVTQSQRYFDADKNAYILEIAVNNLTQENLKISVKNNLIHVKGTIQKVQKTTNSSHSSSAQFAQSYSLPNDADRENIKVDFKNNLLTLVIAKLKNADK